MKGILAVIYGSAQAVTRPAATQWQQKHNEPATESLLWNGPQLKDGGWLIYVTGQILPPILLLLKHINCLARTEAS